MKLDDLPLETLRNAIRIYLGIAWPGKEADKEPEWGAPRYGRELLDLFTDESSEEPGRTTRRYIIRLGNNRYPHMKFVLEEYLIPEQFIFSVDTHDELELKPNYPDYEAWQELKEQNREIKGRIEERWRAQEIPTISMLKEIVEEAGPAGRKKGVGGRILIVDDQREIADAVASVLVSEGFDILIAHDGEEAVDTALLERPDLILMDYQMPKLDGVEAAIRIRKTLSKKKCRILLATAALMDLSAVSQADGFLLKPYSRDILVSFINALLKQ